MKRKFFFLSLAVVLHLSSVCEAGQKTHLLMLSGQSNMHHLEEEKDFTPEIKKLLPNDEIIVAKSAYSGKTIDLWYEMTKSPSGEITAKTGTGYAALLNKVKRVGGNKKYDTITLIWMQGETDAKNKLGEKYADSFKGMVKKLQEDLGCNDINVVIGRLNDCGVSKSDSYPHWKMIREIQMKLGEGNPRWGWVDSDDCNGPENDLHNTPEGYKILGARFAQKAAELITKNSK